MKKYVIKEVSAEYTDFSTYFDDEGLTEKGGDYCYNLFIVAKTRNVSGFNESAYNELQSEIEELLEQYSDIVNKTDCAQHPSVGAMLVDYKLVNNIHNTKQIKAYTQLFAECCEKPSSPYRNCADNFEAHNSELTAKYLTLKTGKEWAMDSASGYCQGDYVELVYCKEFYGDSAKHYGEIWLGAGKEFIVSYLDEEGEEVYTVGGYIVADCQAWKEEEYKKIVCAWADIEEAETEIEMA